MAACLDAALSVPLSQRFLFFLTLISTLLCVFLRLNKSTAVSLCWTLGRKVDRNFFGGNTKGVKYIDSYIHRFRFLLTLLFYFFYCIIFKSVLALEVIAIDIQIIINKFVKHNTKPYCIRKKNRHFIHLLQKIQVL